MTERNNLQNSDKIRRLLQTARLNQTELANKINILLEPIDLQVSQRTISRLLCGDNNLNIPVGLAAASVLNTYLSDLIHDDYLKLGSLETRLFTFDNKQAENLYFSDINSAGRIVVLSRFPSIGLTREYYGLFMSYNTHTWEHHPIDSLLNFAFSPFTPYQIQNRIDICQKMINLASKQGNAFHFFEWNYNQYNIADFMLSRSREVTCIAILAPGFEGFLEIKNAAMYNKLERFFSLDYMNKSVSTTNDESRMLFIKIKELIARYKEPLNDRIVELFEHFPKNSNPSKMLEKFLFNETIQQTQ